MSHLWRESADWDETDAVNFPAVVPGSSIHDGYSGPEPVNDFETLTIAIY